MKKIRQHKVALAIGLFALTCVRAANAGDPIGYKRDVRPILSDACFWPDSRKMDM